MMKNFLSTPVLAIGLAASLGLLAGCAESMDDSTPMQQTAQELVLMSVQPDAPGAQALSVAYSPAQGWHVSLSEQLRTANFPGTTALQAREHSLDLFGSLPGGGNLSGAQSSGGKFSASLASGSGYSASARQGGGFSAQAAGSGGYDEGLAGGGGFNSSIVDAMSFYGGQCSLTTLCDFVDRVCASGADCDGYSPGTCHRELAGAQSQIPAEFMPLVCLVIDLYECMLSGGPQAGPACAASFGFQ